VTSTMRDKRLKENKGRTRGFTLLEMLTSLVILGILVSIAFPSMRWLIVNQRVRNAAFDLSSALTYTRSEASKRANDVIISGGGTNWAAGWTITGPNISGAIETLRQQAAYADITITAPAASLSYRRNGRTDSAGATFAITTTVAGLTAKRCLGIDRDGRVNTSLSSC